MLGDLGKIKEAIASEKTDLSITEPETQNTAIHCALLNDRNNLGTETVQIKILKEILQTGKISPDAPNKDGQTPLFLAAMFGNIEAAKLLIDQEVGLNEVDRFEYTPLVTACRNRAYAVAIELVGKDAIVEHARVDVDELLFAAIEFQNIKAVKSLIESGADRMAQMENGKTVDMMANHASNRELSEIIRSTRSFRFAKNIDAVGKERKGIIGNNSLIINDEEASLDEISSSLNLKTISRSLQFGQDDKLELGSTQFPAIPNMPLPSKAGDFDAELLADRFPRIPTTDLRPPRVVEEPLEVLDQPPTRTSNSARISA
ncbi:ankyrin repeat-containing domain protein [Tricladium varicosporioides]|nr:ankyrin repeat-containing domain protein [Hymenoscyphus varicosporioides]